MKKERAKEAKKTNSVIQSFLSAINQTEAKAKALRSPKNVLLRMQCGTSFREKRASQTSCSSVGEDLTKFNKPGVVVRGARVALFKRLTQGMTPNRLSNLTLPESKKSEYFVVGKQAEAPK